MLLYYNGFYLKQNLDSKTKLIKGLSSEKVNIIREKESLAKEIDKIKGKVTTLTSSSQDLKTLNDTIEMQREVAEDIASGV